MEKRMENKIKTVLGVDVGMAGALAFYDQEELLVYDMPVFARNKTNRPDCHRITKIIKEQAPSHIYIEQVNAFKMGATGAYNFGWSCAVIEAIAAALGIPFTYVTPQSWKKAMNCPKDKDASRSRATQLMPQHCDNWPLKKHDGRAEASLIAMYGFNKEYGQAAHKTV